MRGVFARAAATLIACGLFALHAAAAPGDAPADPQRGADLYAGRLPMTATTTHGAPVPPKLAACVQCHRPSGLGGFEGGAPVPPIAARYLFSPYDADTGRFFVDAGARLRIRPAYDEATLATLLRSGVTPDGQVVRAPMPVYRFDERDARDLAAYLRGLSTQAAPGIDATTVRIATITTPGIDPSRAQAMLEVMHAFEAGRNHQTRQEFRRSAQSRRSHEMVRMQKFRLWKVLHWTLEGDPSTWPAQLERYQTEEPVFALVSGMGAGDWSPVESFCERRRLPCILPQLEQAPPGVDAAQRFFSVYFHAGLVQDLDLALASLRQRGVRSVELWTGAAMPEASRALVARRLDAAGLARVERAARPGEAVLSLLGPDEHLQRWQARGAAPDAVAWLPGARWQPASQWLAGTEGARTKLLVTPLRPSDEAAATMARSREWARSNGLQSLPTDVVANTLYAATVFGEAFMHLDFDFTREYVLELLEHRLETVLPLSPYPRLSIGPDQRVASKGSYVGRVDDGRVVWQWETVAAH